MNPNMKANVVSSSKGARIWRTTSWLKNKSCEPAVKNAGAMAPIPINALPIPTHQNPLGASLAKNSPSKITNPATTWKSGIAIVFNVSGFGMAKMVMARKLTKAN